MTLKTLVRFKTAKRVTLIALLVLGLGPACSSPHADSGGDSSSHWLEACSKNSDCGALECVCGLCTKRCTDSSTCATLAATAHCAAPSAADCQELVPVCVASLTGDSGTDGASNRPPIPPPPDFCAPFHIEYEAGGKIDCGTSALSCPPVDCHCTAYSGPLCSPWHGCVRAVDCAAVCSSDGLWLNCVSSPCTTDKDCSAVPYGPGGVDVPGVCILPPGAAEGVCDSAAAGLCVNDDDCQGRHCVAVQSDGTRQCMDQLGSQPPCNRNEDCDTRNCVLPKDSFLGTCSIGTK